MHASPFQRWVMTAVQRIQTFVYQLHRSLRAFRTAVLLLHRWRLEEGQRIHCRPRRTNLPVVEIEYGTGQT